jgi:predicted Kef-type K+ transport protein
VDQIPLPAHVALDYVLALGLIAMPFIAGFSDETNPTVFFIAIGVLHLLITIGTRFRPAMDRGRGAP